MRYDISLSIDYSFDQESDQSRSLLHLLPLNIPGQQEVSASLLNIDPAPQERNDGIDFFGNRTTWISFLDTISGFSLSLRTQARRLSGPLPMDFSTNVGQLKSEISSINSIAPTSPHHYLGHSPRVPYNDAIVAFARSCVSEQMSTLNAVLAIGQAVHAHMEFDSEATDVHTPLIDAFRQKRGVCQDFSHIMIACLRGLGIPSGYVSGFLRTVPPPGQKRMEGADAMHAWVRVWCGNEMGWIEYDPTNAIIVGDGHIVVAYGRDYSDVSPVRGSLKSSGGHDTNHSVDVVPMGA